MANYRFKPGQKIRFTYRDVTEDSLSRFKEVLVLHPMWQRKMHAIDLKRLTQAERVVLDQIMDPEQKSKTSSISLVNDILRRMNPVEDIKNPVSFYSKFVKVFLRDKDAYRTYYPQKMSGVVVSRPTNVQGQVVNPKPLFKKVETKAPSKPSEPSQAKPKVSGQAAKKPSPATPAKPSQPSKPSTPPAKPMSRLDAIRAAAAKRKQEKK